MQEGMPGGKRRTPGIRGLLWALAWVGAGVRGANEDAFKVERKDGGCLMGEQRTLGYPVDLCDGNWGDVFQNLVQVATDEDVIDENIGTAHVDQQSMLKDCNYATPNPDFCQDAVESYSSWEDTSICMNKRISNTSGVSTVAQGCSLSCECCGGGECDNVVAWIPEPSEDQAPTYSLMIFFHTYGEGSEQAVADFFLDSVVDAKKYILIAPNGRQDDLGFSYWMGTNKFTGRFLNYLNPLTGKMEKMPAPEYQHNATLSQQYLVIAKQNPDVAYTKQLLDYVLAQFPIRPDSIFAFGSGNGGEMAFTVACQLSHYFRGVILHNTTGWSDSDLQSRYCKPTKALHTLIMQPRRNYRPAPDWIAELQNHTSPNSNPSLQNMLLDPLSNLGRRRRRLLADESEEEPTADDEFLRFWSKVNGCQQHGLDATSYPHKTINILRGDAPARSGPLDPLINPLTQPPAPAEPMKASDDTRVFYLGSCSFHSSLTVWEIKDHHIHDLDPYQFSSELAHYISQLPRGRPPLKTWWESFVSWHGWVWMIWLPTIGMYFCFHCGLCDTFYFNKKAHREHESPASRMHGGYSQYGAIPTKEPSVGGGGDAEATDRTSAFSELDAHLQA